MTNRLTEVRESYRHRTKWVVDILDDQNVRTGYVQPNGTQGRFYEYDTKAEAEAAETLYHKAIPDSGEETSTDEKSEIRKFNTGATRDTVEGKLSYVRALSPIVLQRYVQYLDAHRKQPDGSLREFDNWKQGIPTDVYLDGLGRHFLAVWLLAQGFPAKDNHGSVTLENSLCALIFGSSGWLHEILKAKSDRI